MTFPQPPSARPHGAAVGTPGSAASRKQFKPASLLRKALALIIGTEGMIVFKDVLQLHDSEARKVKRWTIRALVEAARKSPASN